jgi:hypothetical protein
MCAFCQYTFIGFLDTFLDSLCVFCSFSVIFYAVGNGARLYPAGSKSKNWRIGGENIAASTSGMHVSVLRGRMKKLGIKKPTPQ